MAIGTKDFEQALGKIGSNDLKHVAEGIGIAAVIESEGISFYSRQAEKFKGQETEHFFNFLAGQEKEHLEAIESLKKALEEKGKWIKPSLPENRKPEIFSKKDWDKDQEEGITAILFALWKEKQAQEFYQAIAEKIKNQGAKEFFKALAEFEKGHAEMLSEFVEDSYYSHELIMG